MTTETEALRGFRNISSDIIGDNLQTAQYMLKISDRLSSTIKGFETFGLVHRWSIGMEHYIQGYLPSQVHPRRPTTGTPLEVYLYHGDYIPKLFQMVAKQEVIPDNSTSLVVLASAGDVNQKILQIDLSSAVLESVQLTTDYFPFFRILIRYKIFAITCYNYDQEKLSLTGNVPFSYDFSQNVVGG